MIPTRAQLLDIEWRGCGCSQTEEFVCPVCGGAQPLYEADTKDERYGDYYGHQRGCWLYKALQLTK